MKYLRLFSLLSVLFFASCKEDPIIGSISFTASHDCDIRLFDSNGNQIARDQYETEKAPFVIQMKRSGAYIVHAVHEDKTIKEPIAYPGGVFERFIEF
ncbi:MAG: hypothetical protein FWD09_09000 [Lentimicrobiaceae bacterium]|nr:hypothetical protein [Lentimicrobiaceae bacterium]